MTTNKAALTDLLPLSMLGISCSPVRTECDCTEPGAFCSEELEVVLSLSFIRRWLSDGRFWSNCELVIADSRSGVIFFWCVGKLSYHMRSQRLPGWIGRSRSIGRLLGVKWGGLCDQWSAGLIKIQSLEQSKVQECWSLYSNSEAIST